MMQQSNGRFRTLGVTIVMSAFLAACSSYSDPVVSAEAQAPAVEEAVGADFERDRQAILAMAGDFEVTFDFTETVAFDADYALKPRKKSSAYEVVRVIEDRGNFISLQHILVVGEDRKFPVKHWRQDWVYEPDSVLSFIGGNAWTRQTVDAAERRGAWAQIVYQVDDSPRYGAVGRWQHRGDISEWSPPAAWRPLPRRDMTTRDDYHVVDAVNRHTITPAGWVHEQDNTKIVLSDGTPKLLTREVGVNTYVHADSGPTAIATNYWQATKGYWANVRAKWDDVMKSSPRFALTVKGESEALYAPVLGYASDIAEGKLSTEEATPKAAEAIDTYITAELAPLVARLRTTDTESQDTARRPVRPAAAGSE